MRTAAVLPLLVPLFIPLIADAGPTGGHNGGSGRLGQVSTGLNGGGSRGGGVPVPPSPPRPPRVDNDTPPPRVVYVYAPPAIALAGATATISRPARYDGGTARIEAYVGAQKVMDSDGSWTVELGVRDGLFRLGGAITRYYERQPDNSNLRLTMPSLTGGVRVDDGGRTRVYLEAGFVNASTQNDPMEDSSHTGGLGGVRLEYAVSRSSTVIGEAHEMFFADDIRAHSMRLGVKAGPVQASFRILDFNVGPALYGPELGLKF